MKYNQTTLQKLEIVFKEMEYDLRYDKGNFISGFCILKEHKTIVVNKFLTLEGRINTLIDLLNHPEIFLDITQKENISFETQKILKQMIHGQKKEHSMTVSAQELMLNNHVL